MNKLIRKAALPAVLSLALFAGTAMAQSTAPAAASPSTAAPTATKSHAQRRMDEVEQQVSDLHDELNITDAQSSQWTAYAQVMRDNAQRTGQALHQRHQQMESMSADDSMKSYAQLAQLNADNMQKLSSAFSALYAVLSPEQKQTADELFKNRPPRAGGHHGDKGGKPASASSAASSGT
ncbi:Spy/CpxP family protein refolding chaperone [Dyella acidiphila]|uniref:Spy/CpxP family protein refolding chaperone n=1 Tax=Dyella acidiphila TaxID=2775866 RepID=A0ABR9G701_9GAMM|nr:Spy/CpxP family protein refolding chaperone [Dyella acidiphila]MBE1159832.1 Spy/CpxP family protein refolding chaperone [Dyella acidiphila]